MTLPAFEQNAVLTGLDPEEGIVAVEPSGDKHMRLFQRRNEALETADVPFTPFILVKDGGLLDGFKRPFTVEALSPGNDLDHLVLFESWRDCLKARTHLQGVTGESPSSGRAPYLFISDPVQQFLVLTGKTFFKGMPFESLHRMAVDIETACAPGYEFSNPKREEDKILSVALMDNRGYSEVLFGEEMDEKAMLTTLVERIQTHDPDVVEGHNVFNFDLDYIVARAKRHGVKLRLGRDGSVPKVRRSRFSVAERTIDYSRMEIYGRHVVDTMFLLQNYDVTARELESYGLKAAARHFGLDEEDRTYIDRDRIQWYYENDPEALRAYNLDDVRETLALSNLLGYSFFLQARIFPFSYQNIFVRGNATKINALFLREYIRRRASVPKPKGGGAFAGGYTDVFSKGLVRNVIHCDVASLYPSIMIVYDLKPKGDTEGVFLPLLKDLRTFRLEAKSVARRSEDPNEREYYNSLQQTFKVLINSFYGYLGTAIHSFSDPEAAAEVTRLGRQTLHAMVDWLKAQGAKPVELDTDGIYFVPPEGMESDEEAKALVDRLSGSLPEGIDVEMDGRYRAMFSYKMKNYALLDENGKVSIKGSALKSRGMERYLREFLADMLKLLLEDRADEIVRLRDSIFEALEGHEIDISKLAKTETLNDSPGIYRQKVESKKRNPAAAYELALASDKEHRAGDQVSYYVTGTAKRVRVYDQRKTRLRLRPRTSGREYGVLSGQA